ncbi:MAG: amidohydrolase family protein [Planctomycetota bacterium]
MMNRHVFGNKRTSQDRRSFLAQSAAGAAVLASAASGVGTGWVTELLKQSTVAAEKEQPTASEQRGYVDAHSHIWSREVAKFPLAKGQTVEDLKPASFTAEEAIALMKPLHVSRIVLIQHHIYHGWDNAYLIDAARRYPQVFRVVGMVDDTTARPDEQMRQLLKQRVTAFRITSLIRGAGKWLEGEGMAAMWRCAAETRQAMCCLINPEDLPAVGAMCRQYPDTPVVIDHFARIGMTGEIRAADVDQLVELARHKQTAVKISAYYALGKKKPPYDDMLPLIRRLCDAYGPERLMWASDCPYQLGEGNGYEPALAVIRDRADFLSAADRQWLLAKTAERFFYYV